VNKLIKSVWLIMIAVMITGCANLRTAKLASGNDPKKAVAEVTQIMMTAQREQHDVLADEQYSLGSDYLVQA